MIVGPIRPLLTFCLLMSLLPAHQNQCQAAEQRTSQQITGEIFARELDMQKLNGYLHLEAADPSFRRARRTWLWDIGNGLATEGGLITATTIFWKHSQDKSIVDREIKVENDRAKLRAKTKRIHNQVGGSTVAGTLYPQIVGQSIGASGAMLELACDIGSRVRIHRRHLDGNAVIRRMTMLNTETEALLTELRSANDVSFEEAQLLTDFKREILQEFMRLEGQAGNIFAGQIIEDSVSLIRNSVGLIGNSINVRAVLNNNKRLNGSGNVLNFIAASLIATRPMLSNAGAAIFKRRNEKRAKQYFPELSRSTADLDADMLALSNRPNANPSLKRRLRLYAEQIQKFHDERELAIFEEERAKQITVRRYRETIYAPTKMSQSVLGMILSFESGNNPTRDNRLSAAGNTSYTTGQIFNICELSRERIADEIDHNKAKREFMLPSDRVKRQLASVAHLKEELAAKE